MLYPIHTVPGQASPRQVTSFQRFASHLNQLQSSVIESRFFMTDFSDQFRKIIIRYKRIGYNLNVMRQSACLVINPITVDSYAALFDCTPVDRASDSMMAPT